MSISGKFGSACFLENLRLFANPKTEPEKYNLYNGLRGKADDLETLSLSVHKLEMLLNSIHHQLGNRT